MAKKNVSVESVVAFLRRTADDLDMLRNTHNQGKAKIQGAFGMEFNVSEEKTKALKKLKREILDVTPDIPWNSSYKPDPDPSEM